MARDHTRINLDIWGDDDFRELPVDAQNLYWTLWTSPARTYCGSHYWHPGKLSQCAGDWTVDRILMAAKVLSERLFLVVDDVTEECLLRSWIKHDGLWKVPNMAVTVAVARAGMGSKTLRGIVVHEVQKLRDTQPGLSSWTRDEVVKMLEQNAINPASIPPFNPTVNPPVKGYAQSAVNPPANMAPTTATTTSYLTTATPTEAPRKRAAPRKRVDPEYVPPKNVIDDIRAETNATDEQLRYQHRKFIDHWRKTGKPMADWDACWRNWMRTSHERGEIGQPTSSTAKPNKLRALADLAAEVREMETVNGKALEA